MEIRIGPSGIGGKKEAICNLERFHEEGIRNAEIAFTYGVYLDKESALEIGEKAKELDIVLSIHAPYFVNLNSPEKEKISASKKRILSCCEIGHYLASAWKGKRKLSIVFHPGYYGKGEREEAFENISEKVDELMKEVKENKWNVILCPEVMGKRNVFGSIEEISKLVKKTGCGCCIDFAHILARYDNNMFEEIRKGFGDLEKWHCHFSGIVYGDKGEKHHKQTLKEEWQNLFNFLKTLKGMKEIVIVSEAPNPEKDAKDVLSYDFFRF